MTVNRININQQMAQISVRRSSARMQITKPRGQMTIRTETPKMQLSTTMPTFHGNRQRVNNESGLAGPLTFAKSFRDKGRQAAMRATANYKNDGNFIANPNIPGDKSIPLLSKNKMKRALERPEINVGLMPSSPPSLNWTRGDFSINWSGHSVSVDWTGENTASINADIDYPVQVSLSRRPSINVSSVSYPANNDFGRYINAVV